MVPFLLQCSLKYKSGTKWQGNIGRFEAYAVFRLLQLYGWMWEREVPATSACSSPEPTFPPGLNVFFASSQRTSQNPQHPGTADQMGTGRLCHRVAKIHRKMNLEKGSIMFSILLSVLLRKSIA